MSNVKWKPVFAILPKKTPNGKDRWYRVGVAFPNSDGSLSIDLAAVPMGCRIQVREQDDKYADRKPHPLDPVETDPFDSLPLPPVMQ
jgi:hypothetical protein